MELTRLTDNERKFAEDNHKLIYSFLSSYSIEDYYNIVVFGYLKAIQVYSKRADLQVFTCRAIPIAYPGYVP